MWNVVKTASIRQPTQFVLIPKVQNLQANTVSQITHVMEMGRFF